jgi:protocadherin Fat 1/2/3
LSEGVHPGSYVLTVLATDIDEEPNANLRFYLTGEGADHFALDKAAGINFHKIYSYRMNK